MVGYLKKIVKRKFLWFFILFVALGLAVYCSSFNNQFVWDDEGQVLQNPLLSSVANVPGMFAGGEFYGGDNKRLIGTFYRPFVPILYTFIHQIAGKTPFYYHLVQTVLHSMAAFLLFYLLVHMTSRKDENDDPFPWAPLLLALVFLIHPMQVESAIYIAAIGEPVSFIFGILALIVTLRSRTTTAAVAAHVLILLALLGKETGVLFFGLILAADRLYRRGNLRLHIGLFCITTVAYLYLRCGLAHMCSPHAGIGKIGELTLSGYVMHVPALLYYYIQTFVAPIRLATAQTWTIDTPTFATFTLPLIVDIIVIVSVLGFLFRLFIIQADTRHPLRELWRTYRYAPPLTYTFFLIWLSVGMLFPMQILPLEFTVADRWFYFPLAGLLGLAAVLARSLPMLKRTRVATLVASLVALLLLTIRTQFRIRDWKDNFSLFFHDVLVSPDSYYLQDNLGVEYYRRGNVQQAIYHYKESVKRYPFDYAALVNLGVAYERLGDPKTAESYYTRALKGNVYFRAYEKYAQFLISQDRIAEARVFIHDALKRFPENTTLKTLKGKL